MAAALVVGAGCRAPRPWQPAPASPIPVGPSLCMPGRATLPSEAGGGAEPAPSIAEVGRGEAVGPPSPPAPPLPPAAHVVFEPPYKLDARPVPQSRAAQQADFAELRRWNDGGLGSLTAELLPPEGHPDPRVRVDVERAQGPLDAATIQRHARQSHWMNVVRCYQLAAYRRPTLHGWTRGRFTITKSGKVARPRVTKSELDEPAVSRCLLTSLGQLRFPPRRGGTAVTIAIKVSPGDDPLPPPADEIVPGPGELTAEQMLAGIEPARGDFEACLRAGWAYAPELWGRIPIRFHVTATGELDEAFDGGGRFPDARVRQCVLRRARALRFARPAGGDLRFVVPVRLYSDRSPIPPPAP